MYESMQELFSTDTVRDPNNGEIRLDVAVRLRPPSPFKHVLDLSIVVVWQ